MAIRRANLSFQVGTALPRDMMTVTPHYETTGGASDQALADSLKAKLLVLSNVGSTVPFTVRIYDAQGPPPHYPLGSADNVGTTPKAVNGPRELALCLSYYAGINRPRFRGRIYIPLAFMTATVGGRPTAGMQNEALAWGASLFKSLPTGCIAAVYSRVNNLSSQITNYWVDNEWDIIRSRGDRSTSRVTGTVP